MRSYRQSWLKLGLHFCGSCFISLLYWATWIILSVSLAGLLYIVVIRELPVPDFVLRRVEARFAENNFAISFGRARFDLTGKILLEEVQLRSRKFDEPLLKSRLLYIRRSFWSILAGRPIPDEISLEGATLQLPALLSPSGTAEPLVKDLAVVLRHDEHIWHLDQLTGRIGRLTVTAQGDYVAPVGTRGVKASTPEELVAQLLQFGRRVVLETNHLESFERPTLRVYLENQTNIGTTAALIFSADAAHQPWGQPIELSEFTVSSTLRLSGSDEQSTRVRGYARHISRPGAFSLESVEGVLLARITPSKFSALPSELSLTIGSISADGEQVLAPVIHADLRTWPNITASTTVQISHEFISADISVNLADQSARIRAEGSGSPEIINRVLAKHTPRAAPYFIFSDPVRVSAEATLSPGWRFNKLSSRVIAGRINSHDVKITAARGRIDIVGMNFLAYDAQVEMDENLAKGSYWMDFTSTDYRMLLVGKLRPPKISGWFNGNWWTDFWNEHFDFPKVLPDGDVDVQGRWRDASRTEYFGHAGAESARVWGGNFDRVEASVFLRPFFTHVIEFNGTRANGTQRLSGSLKRLADSGGKDTGRIEFDLSGNVDPETYHGMLEGKADEVMTALQFNAPPFVQARGEILGQGAAAKSNYTFTGKAEGGLHYYDFPLADILVSGTVAGTDVSLNSIQFSALGGTGTGKATLSGSDKSRLLGFDLYLNGAELGQTILGVQEYQTKHQGKKPTYGSNSELIKRVTGGHLDVSLSAQGTPETLTSFSGTGNAALTGADLGEIQLFGLLSQVLSGLSLNFSSLKLNSAYTSFRIEKGLLHFPDLKISGPSAVIDARGDYGLETNALNFTAKFKPFEESKTLLTAAIGIVINPITSILELKLTGPLNEPNWSIAFGSSLPHDGSTPSKEINHIDPPENSN